MIILSIIAQSMTGFDGNYSFSNIPVGEYSLQTD
ncbi:MAG: carboxypeptidase regulatory-like domain-containing protein [Aureispira sp.]|nr:carboxypeptidase regulatory-like domain-containing protein [Aureispira sp.]